VADERPVRQEGVRRELGWNWRVIVAPQAGVAGDRPRHDRFRRWLAQPVLALGEHAAPALAELVVVLHVRRPRTARHGGSR
jgi:hypothetical protein